MEINELQELVLSNLSVDEQEADGETRSPAEIFASGRDHNVSFDLFISDIKETVDNLETLSGPEVLYAVASLTARSKVLSSSFYSFPNAYVQLLFHAINYQQFADKADLRPIADQLLHMSEAHIKERQKRMVMEATGSKERILDILEDVWGGDLQSNLVEITGVTAATAKKWLSGANIGGSNFRRLQTLAKIFHALKSEKGYSREDLASWYDSPLPDGQTPRQAFTLTSWWGCPESVRQFMKDEGLPNF